MDRVTIFQPEREFNFSKDYGTELDPHRKLDERNSMDLETNPWILDFYDIEDFVDKTIRITKGEKILILVLALTLYLVLSQTWNR